MENRWNINYLNESIKSDNETEKDNTFDIDVLRNDETNDEVEEYDNSHDVDYIEPETASHSIEGKDFPEKVNQVILSVLKNIGRSKFYYLFVNNPETLPLIANAVNKLAKEQSSGWYEYKPLLIGETIKRHSKTWINEDDTEKIAYSETPYGQISFHTFNNESELANRDEYGINGADRVWSGEATQNRAFDIIDEYIDDATRNLNEESAIK